MAEKYAKFTTIYEDFGEREVQAVVLYANASKLYVDSKHTTEVSHDEALDLCMKGYLRILDTETYYSVASFGDSAGTLTIGYGESQTVTVGPAA